MALNLKEKISRLKLTSVEDASIIRKFSVFFSLMSFLPFVVLSVLFFIFVTRGEIKIKPDLFFWAVFLIGIFALIGFVSMRRTFTNLTRLSKSAQDIIKGDLSSRIDIQAEADNEVTQLARSFNEIVHKLENNIRQLEKSKKTVQEVLIKVASGISSTQNTDAFLDLILSTTVDALDGKVGVLLVHSEAKNEMVIKSICGFGTNIAKEQAVPVDDEVIGWVIKQKRPLLIPRLHKVSAATSGLNTFEPPLICAPMVFQNRVLGAVSVSGKKQDGSFEEDELVILSNIASQVALAIENARLNADNQKAYLETISALAMAVEARDIYSRGHSDRVCDSVVKIAKELKLSDSQIQTLKAAAQLHDVGKIGISDDILRKTGMFNDVERQIMEQHPVIGEGIIVPLHGFLHLRDAIKHHHEWLNGEGYPDHLKGGQISQEAKILAVADCFDAMTTDRPYQKAKDFTQAKEEMLQYSGIRYDKEILDALFRALEI